MTKSGCVQFFYFIEVYYLFQKSISYLQASWATTDHPPAVDWPREGAVELRNYSCRYRDGLDLVLNDVSCKIKAGEKVRILTSLLAKVSVGAVQAVTRFTFISSVVFR